MFRTMLLNCQTLLSTVQEKYKVKNKVLLLNCQNLLLTVSRYKVLDMILITILF